MSLTDISSRSSLTSLQLYFSLSHIDCLLNKFIMFFLFVSIRFRSELWAGHFIISVLSASRNLQHYLDTDTDPYSVQCWTEEQFLLQYSQLPIEILSIIRHTIFFSVNHQPIKLLISFFFNCASEYITHEIYLKYCYFTPARITPNRTI